MTTDPASESSDPTDSGPPTYISEGGLYAVVVTDAAGERQPTQVVGSFESLDQAEEWAEDHVGLPYAVVPFETASGPTTDDTTPLP